MKERKDLVLLTDEQIANLSRAEQVCFGLVLLLNHAREHGVTVDVCSMHNKFMAGYSGPDLSEAQAGAMEMIKWSRDNEGIDNGWYIFV